MPARFTVVTWDLRAEKRSGTSAEQRGEARW
jgi:hypothetical protein